ncbi:MAG: hypothetical protein Q8N77_01910, partial [Nanoarchaeota archaeon]|nr:hypothetical protein [Nanoarchaeota archaeon]
GYCEDCTPDGLSPGQEKCAAYYDCTPEWWVKEGKQYSDYWTIDPSDLLDWGDCGEDKQSGRDTVSDLTRQRLICPPGLTKEQCCGDPDSDGDFQEHCYCKVPDAETMVEFSCDNPDFRPTEIKACLAEEKFPFFTNMNMLIAVLVLIGFYIWKNRTQEKTKKRK